MSIQQYIEEKKVKGVLRDATTSMFADRPDDVKKYLAAYFTDSLDKDKPLTLNSIDGGLNATWDAMDLDKNGELSCSELRRAMKLGLLTHPGFDPKSSESLKKMLGDDGVLSKKEFMRGFAKVLTRDGRALYC